MAMQIGELATRAGLSLSTLRHYDEVGLVTPSRRSAGGFRLYTEEDLERLLVIRRMKPLGYTTEEMRALLDLVDRLPAAVGDERKRLELELDEMVAEASRRRAALAAKLAMADEFVDLLRHHR